MRRFQFCLYLCCLFLTIAGTHKSFAQINTDRPTQSASALVLPAGRFQVETGAQYTHFDAFANQFTYQATLLRYGLNDLFELRFSTSYERLDRSFTGAEREYTGFSPVVIGFKSKIADENGFWPQVSILGQTALPSGEEVFEVNTAVPAFRFNFQHTLNDQHSIGYNWGMEWSDGSSAATNIYTFIYNLSFAGSFTVFAEFYGFIADGLNDHRFDTGLIYLFSDNLQADISGGFGLSDEAPDGFLGLGLSFYVK